MDRQRQALGDLSARLLQLHTLLLDRARRAYEARHGALTPRELLPLVIHDEHFAWLRPLSGMIARIDELLDAGEPLGARDVEMLFQEAARLLRSDAHPVFHPSYRDALQESPDVVIAHADVVKLLPKLPSP